MENSNNKNLTAAFAPTADCLAIDELTIVLEGRRGEELQRRAEAHTAACLRCRTELALLREFESPTIRAGERSDVDSIVARLRKNSPAAPVPWWKRLGTIRFLAPVSIALAAALVALGIGLQMRQTLFSPVPPPGRDVMRSQSLDIVAPLGQLTAIPTELRWRAVTAASRYRVRLLEVDRTELWTTTVSQTSVALPATVREKIVPLKTLVWEITALDASGASLASSGSKVFRLQANTSR